MTNQDLNELRDINKQLEELQNQKRIIQQKLQDENDIMMVENHIFSQPDVQDLIQEIENDFPDFKINIDYKANKMTISCQNIDLYSFPEKFKEITKKDLMGLLETQLKLKPIYMILINSGFIIKESTSNYLYHETIVIEGYNKDKNIKTQLVFDEKLNIRHLKTYKSILNETIVLFKLKKYNVEMMIESDSHYNSYNGDTNDDLFTVYIKHYDNDVNINNLQEKIQNGIQILENARDTWEDEWWGKLYMSNSNINKLAKYITHHINNPKSFYGCFPVSNGYIFTAPDITKNHIYFHLEKNNHTQRIFIKFNKINSVDKGKWTVERFEDSYIVDEAAVKFITPTFTISDAKKLIKDLPKADIIAYNQAFKILYPKL